jgi:predicted lipoprotein with Yx(FWY)xxD motif
MGRIDMKISYIALLVVALMIIGCGDGEVADTTVATPDAAAPGDTATDQTPPPETTPERAAETTAPMATPTAPPATGPTYDYGPRNDGASGGGSSDEEETDGAAMASVEAAESDLGQILVGQEGLTLYVFLPDEQTESTCYDACAATWPPVEGEVGAGAGVDESMLGTTERDDGTTQATYNGWPLYYYASDSEPGDVTGQGVGDNWFVIDPAGEVVEG